MVAFRFILVKVGAPCTKTLKAAVSTPDTTEKAYEPLTVPTVKTFPLKDDPPSSFPLGADVMV